MLWEARFLALLSELGARSPIFPLKLWLLRRSRLFLVFFQSLFFQNPT